MHSRFAQTIEWDEMNASFMCTRQQKKFVSTIKTDTICNFFANFQQKPKITEFFFLDLFLVFFIINLHIIRKLITDKQPCDDKLLQSFFSSSYYRLMLMNLNRNQSNIYINDLVLKQWDGKVTKQIDSKEGPH